MLGAYNRISQDSTGHVFDDWVAYDFSSTRLRSSKDAIKEQCNFWAVHLPNSNITANVLCHTITHYLNDHSQGLLLCRKSHFDLSIHFTKLKVFTIISCLQNWLISRRDRFPHRHGICHCSYPLFYFHFLMRNSILPLMRPLLVMFCEEDVN